MDYSKSPDGLVPAIIQDNVTGKVLMLGYMNEESLKKTLETKKVTFWSRSRNELQRLWTKGEESGHFLDVVSIAEDCDHDTLLIKVNPHGPTCHTGADTCWNERNVADDVMFLKELQDFIDRRHADGHGAEPLHAQAPGAEEIGRRRRINP